MFNYLGRSVEFSGNLNIPIFYNKTGADAIDDELSSLFLNTYTKAEVYNSITNIDLSGSKNIGITNNQISLTYPFNN